MSETKTTVFFTRYQRNNEKTPKIKIGTWTDQQKQDFIKKLGEHIPTSFWWPCTLNVHYDKLITHVRGFYDCHTYVPMRPQNKKNEMIIEVIPRLDDATDCPITSERDCPGRVHSGGCPSLLIQDFIGEIFFKDKYTQR